jgi:ribose/xylose/arabinose/galactoside ABC-type transport system permease subunit
MIAQYPALARSIERYGIVLVVLAMMGFLYALQPEHFLKFSNLMNVLKQNSMNGLLALGMFLVILTAGIDLSVGSIMALSMVTLALANAEGVPWQLVILIGPLVGLLCGLVNGLGLTLLRLPHPFIMTLGTQFVFRGLTNLVSNGAPISGLPETVRYVGFAQVQLPYFGAAAAVPANGILFIVCYLCVALFLHKTSIGRHIYAIGGNPQAARVSGINVNGILTLVYMLSGFFAGLAGLVTAGRTGSGYPNAGMGAELDAIAAVVIGGASFFGGRGTVLGVFAGVFIIGLLRNGLNLNNVSPFWQQVLIGSVIILAVYADVLRRQAAVRK